MALGLQAIGNSARGFVLTTDADSTPAADWVWANAASLHEVDVVAGHIVRRNAPRLALRFRLETYLERLRTLQRTIDPISYDPAPSHSSVGGASLGFRASVYERLGGFAQTPSDEDANIVIAARRAGFAVRHDRFVRVTTSSRRRGRARGGLADELRKTCSCATLPKVEHPAEAAAKYARHAAARRAYADAKRPRVLEQLARTLNLPAGRVAELASTAPSADAFTMLVVPAMANRNTVDLAQAEKLLPEVETEYGCYYL